MSTQLALRLTDDLLADLDWLVARCQYSSRTEAMRVAIETAIQAERSRAIDEQYKNAYTAYPQTLDELADLTFQSSSNLDDDAEDWSWL
jgi:metal-responsive CopG/Arc/MetJ family transcriptional regulator